MRLPAEAMSSSATAQAMALCVAEVTAESKLPSADRHTGESVSLSADDHTDVSRIAGRRTSSVYSAVGISSLRPKWQINKYYE